jgi:hypothetical protein
MSVSGLRESRGGKKTHGESAHGDRPFDKVQDVGVAEVEFLTVQLLLREDVEPRRLEDLPTELVLVLTKPADGGPGGRIELLTVFLTLARDLLKLTKTTCGRKGKSEQHSSANRKGAKEGKAHPFSLRIRSSLR